MEFYKNCAVEIKGYEASAPKQLHRAWNAWLLVSLYCPRGKIWFFIIHARWKMALHLPAAVDDAASPVTHGGELSLYVSPVVADAALSTTHVGSCD